MQNSCVAPLLNLTCISPLTVFYAHYIRSILCTTAQRTWKKSQANRSRLSIMQTKTICKDCKDPLTTILQQQQQHAHAVLAKLTPMHIKIWLWLKLENRNSPLNICLDHAALNLGPHFANKFWIRINLVQFKFDGRSNQRFSCKTLNQFINLV